MGASCYPKLFNNSESSVNLMVRSLIDRAAQALAAFQSGSEDWYGLGADRQDYFRGSVRKALETLRDPDARMGEAGAVIVGNVGPSESREAHISDAENTWRYMIDALLSEDN